MNVIVRPGANDTIDTATLEFKLRMPPKDPIIIPIYN
jgi:hypothetical protein